MGWNWDTITYLYQWAIGIPLKLPEMIQRIMAQIRVLGAAGSGIVFIFLAAVFYSLVGRKRILAQIEKKVQLLKQHVPQTLYPFLFPPSEC